MFLVQGQVLGQLGTTQRRETLSLQPLPTHKSCQLKQTLISQLVWVISQHINRNPNEELQNKF